MRNILLLLAIILFCSSCDDEVGTEGVVQDSVTGQAIPGVSVKMNSEDQGSETDLTDGSGYFNTYKSFSCGLASCNTDYTVTFTKDNYETVTIGHNYRKTADFADPETRDTIIVRLVPSN